MFHRSRLTICLLVLGMSAALPTVAQAEEFKDTTVAKTLGKAVITCIRPSTLLADKGYEPYLLDAKRTSSKKGRLDLTFEMRFYGAITKNPYTSKFTIKTDVNGGFEILGIDYTDDCIFPAPDLRLLIGLIRELNAKFKDE
jgi:hypothetical protein